jgi:NAD(P)-dependent dehydrogenase (short-subunit alcohol dehydrogenase family)
MLDKRIMLLQKRALLVFKSVALELGSRNIRCNVIAPGFIETEMTAKLNEDVVKDGEGIPLKRGGTTEDVTNACLFCIGYGVCNRTSDECVWWNAYLKFN